ncbi:MAG TPA: hypothetical protein VNC39_03075 [Acidocella sp.]|jgi:hypothetical protein|uniref:hypothetical protein n=1 Tax=Acidocella sp. TaxID=50710 RepID=UPI002C45A00D|nr:hypothetical protein [Acidocella sp.]HVE20931.1 hypothetical protein [Acidocella sp.]
MELANGIIELQKPDGLVQFDVQLGSTGTFVLGTAPSQTSVQTYATGPLYLGSITLAPTPNFKISIGQLDTLEGYTAGLDWNNSNVFYDEIFAVQNGPSRSVEATYTFGPISTTVNFGDGFDTGVWNYLQASTTYTINNDNAVTIYGATNVGRTGLNAHFYGSASLPFSQTAIGSIPGAVNLANSTVLGGFYNDSVGNLNLVPEIQYVYTRPDQSLVTPGSAAMTKFSGNFGAVLFADYHFGTSPYSLGAWVAYFSSHGPDTWFLNAGSQGVGISIAPTWQRQHLFVRGDLGVMHLTRIGTPGSAGYGESAACRNQATSLLEAGVLF